MQMGLWWDRPGCKNTSFGNFKTEGAQELYDMCLDLLSL